MIQKEEDNVHYNIDAFLCKVSLDSSLRENAILI
jgi:hypothetical protein